MDIHVSTAYDRAFIHCGQLAAQHRLLSPNVWLEWLIRETQNPRLFLLRHLWADSTVLCAWVYSPAEATTPLFQELEAFKGDPRAPWPSDLMHPSQLLRRLEPLPLDGTLPFRRAQEEAKTAQRRLQEVAGAEKDDMVRSLRRRGHESIAHSISTGAVPWLPSTMQDKETAALHTKQLVEASKGL